MLAVAATWWHSNGWTVIIGAAVTIFVAIVVAIAQRRPKRLEYSFDYDIPMIVGQKTLSNADRLEVTWDDEPLKEPRIVAVIVTNAGRREIRQDDWATPFTLSAPDSEIKSAIVEHWRPGVLPEPTELAITDHSAHLPPILLNPSDWVCCHLVLDGNGDVKVDARIAGETRRIRQADSHSWWRLPAVVIALAVADIITTASLGISFYPHYSPPNVDWIPALLVQLGQIGAIALFFGCVSFFNRLIRRRRARREP